MKLPFGKFLELFGVFFITHTLIVGKHYIFFDWLDVNILLAMLLPFWYGCYYAENK